MKEFIKYAREKTVKYTQNEVTPFNRIIVRDWIKLFLSWLEEQDDELYIECLCIKKKESIQSTHICNISDKECIQSWDEEFEKIKKKRDGVFYGYYQAVFEEDFSDGYPVSVDDDIKNLILAEKAKSYGDGYADGSQIAPKKEEVKKIEELDEPDYIDNEVRGVAKLVIIAFRKINEIIRFIKNK